MLKNYLLGENKLLRNNPLGVNPQKNSLLNGVGENLMKYLIKKRKLRQGGEALLLKMLLHHGLLQLSRLINLKVNLLKLLKSLLL